MSRATFTRVFSVWGASVVASAAHASSMPIPAPAATATTGIAVVAPCRKIRRLYLPRRSTSLMGYPPLNVLLIALFPCFDAFSSREPVPTSLENALAEAATFLDHLDLVAVGIGDEEKARKRRAVMLEIAQRPGREFLALEAGVFGIEIVDHDG